MEPFFTLPLSIMDLMSGSCPLSFYSFEEIRVPFQNPISKLHACACLSFAKMYVKEFLQVWPGLY